jgi:hypothetical protein
VVEGSGDSRCVAVTAAVLPYPNLCYAAYGGCAFDLQGTLSLHLNPGFAWVTEPDARSLASAQAPLSYFLKPEAGMFPGSSAAAR